MLVHTGLYLKTVTIKTVVATVFVPVYIGMTVNSNHSLPYNLLISHLITSLRNKKHIETHTAILRLSGFCPRQPGWTSTIRNIHPLTPIVVINHPSSASSIYYDPWHPLCLTYVPDSLFPQSLSTFTLVYLLVLHPPLHTPYISSHSFASRLKKDS